MARLLDALSDYLAHRKGLLPLVGCLLVVLNLLLRLFLPDAWLSSTDLLLHLGIVTAIFGLLLARAL